MAGEGFKIADAYVQVTVKDDTADGEKRVTQRLGNIKATAQLKLDIADTEAKIKQVQAALDGLKAKASQGLNVDADIAAAQAKLDELKAKLDSLNNKTVTVDVDVDRGITSLTRFNTASTKSLGIFSGLTAGAGAMAAAIGAAPAGFTALAGVVGVLGASLNGVDDAMKTYQKDLDKGMTSQAAFADATKKLNQPQKDFVQELIDTKTNLKPLQDTASQAFLPGLTQGLKDANGLFPIFQDFLKQTGTIMGDTAKKMGELFKTDQFKQNLQKLQQSTQPITQAVGDAFVQMTSKLVDFGAKMQPAAQGLADFITDAKDGISGFLDALAPHADSFKKIFDSLGQIIKDLLPIIGQIAGDIADTLAPALQKVADWISQNKDSIKPVAEALLALFVTLKAANLLADVTKWVTGVTKLFDQLGVSAKKNKGAVDSLTGSVSGKKGGSFLGAAGIAGAGLFVAGSLAKQIPMPDPKDTSFGAQLQGRAHAAGDLLTGDLSGAVSDMNNVADPTAGETGGAKVGASLFGVAWKPMEDFFNGTVVPFFQQVAQKLKTAWQAVSTFFTVTIPQVFQGLGQKLQQGWQQVSTFFTQTIPQFFQQQVVQRLKTAWQQVSNFFTQTIPQFFQQQVMQKLKTAWKTVVQFFTMDIPTFFTQTLPQKLKTAWQTVSNWFTVDIPQFFTQTVPQKLKEAWTAVSNWFTQTVPDFFKNNVVQPLTDAFKTVQDWFTTTVPDFFKNNVVQPLTDAFETVKKFFTDTIPNFFTQTVPGLLDTAWQAVVNKVKSLLNDLASAVTSAGKTAGGSEGAGLGGGNAPSSANGNLFIPMANGGVTGLTPMAGGSATVVPPNTWRIVGDNMTSPELYAPLDGSQRSLSLIRTAAGMFGQALVPLSALGMAAGGVLGAAGQAGGGANATMPAATNPAAAGGAVMTTRDGLAAAILQAWNQGVVPILSKTIPEFLKKNAPAAIDLGWDGIKTLLTKQLPEYLKKTAQPALKTSFDGIQDLFGKKIPKNLTDNAVPALSGAGGKVTDVLGKQIPDSITNNAVPALSGAGKSATDVMGTQMPDALNQAQSSLSSAGTNVTNVPGQQMPQALNQAQQSLSTAGTQVTNEVGQTLPQGIQQAASSLQSADQQVISALQQLVQQIQQLAQQAQSEAASAANSAANSAAGGVGSANGNLFTPMARGGMLTPMSGARATVVPPNTWRVVGDNMKHSELFAPLDGSDRSKGLVRMAAGMMGMATAPARRATDRRPATSAKPGMGPVNIHITQQAGSPTETARLVALGLRTVA